MQLVLNLFQLEPAILHHTNQLDHTIQPKQLHQIQEVLTAILDLVVHYIFLFLFLYPVKWLTQFLNLFVTHQCVDYFLLEPERYSVPRVADK